MKKREIAFTPKNIAYYIIGVFILSLGAVAGVISDLGAGPWDTTSYNFSLLTNMYFGYASAIVMGTLILITILLSKKWTLIVLVVNTIIVSNVINFWFITVFNEYIAPDFIIGVPFYILSVITIPLGLALIVASHFPAMVFDELTFAIMKTFHIKSIALTRIGLESTGAVLGILFGVLHDGTLGTVGVGTIIMALVIGPIFSFYLKILGVRE